MRNDQVSESLRPCAGLTHFGEGRVNFPLGRGAHRLHLFSARVTHGVTNVDYTLPPLRRHSHVYDVVVVDRLRLYVKDAIRH